MFGNQQGQNIAQFINSHGNNVYNVLLRQVDETCFYQDDKKKCTNQFQEKCNLCQSMFCKVHLHVQERYFLCHNCRSIYFVQSSVEQKQAGCILCATYGAVCFCIGPIVYGIAMPLCLKNWSDEAHNKHRIENKPHLTCKGFKALCGIINVECIGHGPVGQVMHNQDESRVPLLSGGGGGGGNVTAFSESNRNSVSNRSNNNETTFNRSNQNEVTN